jgi:hypothetical protein
MFRYCNLEDFHAYDSDRTKLPETQYCIYSEVETYSRIGLIRSYGNLQSYWITTELWKLTVVLDYYGAIETYSRIGLLRSYGNLQSYWTITKLWKLTVVLDCYEAMGTYSSIGLSIYRLTMTWRAPTETGQLITK